MALSATSAVGASAMNAAGPHWSGQSDTDAPDSEDRCDELALEIPGTIELRVDDNSPSAWRELHLGGSGDAPYWQAIAGGQDNRAGWRPVRNLSAMSFAPPLANSLKRGVPNYLAYAPAEPQTSVEQDQLVALTMDFGAYIGTFEWNGRAYRYTVVNKLPCFPGPVASK
jgi:hypothetical protein